MIESTNPHSNLVDWKQGLSLKAEGNEFFKKQDFVSAISSYNSAIEILANTQESSSEVVTNLLGCYLNLSLIYLKQNNPYKAIEFANKGIKLNTKSAKAWYRRGEANLK